MKTIKEINKLFDEKFTVEVDVTFDLKTVVKKRILNSMVNDDGRNIKDFYTQQILSLIEELEGKKKL